MLRGRKREGARYSLVMGLTLRWSTGDRRHRNIVSVADSDGCKRMPALPTREQRRTTGAHAQCLRGVCSMARGHASSYPTPVSGYREADPQGWKYEGGCTLRMAAPHSRMRRLTRRWNRDADHRCYKECAVNSGMYGCGDRNENTQKKSPSRDRYTPRSIRSSGRLSPGF